MKAGSANRSAARVNDFLKTLEAELAGSLAGRLNGRIPLSQIPQPLRHTSAKAPEHLGQAAPKLIDFAIAIE